MYTTGGSPSNFWGADRIYSWLSTSSEGPPPGADTLPAVVDERFVLDSVSVFRTVRRCQRLGFKQETSIEDSEKQCLFRVHRYRKRRQYLHDAADQPVLCVEKDKVSLHTFKRRGRWKAYRGADPEEKNTLFNCKQLKSDLIHVFLPTNTSNETTPDFIIRGKDGLKFTVQHDDQVIAETKKAGDGNRCFKVKKILTTTFAGVDQAFIAAILILMEGESVYDPSTCKIGPGMR